MRGPADREGRDNVVAGAGELGSGPQAPIHKASLLLGGSNKEEGDKMVDDWDSKMEDDHKMVDAVVREGKGPLATLKPTFTLL